MDAPAGAPGASRADLKRRTGLVLIAAVPGADRPRVRARGLSRLARDRVAAAAIASTSLSELAGAAATAGFPRALLRLVDELEAARVTPQRLTQALRTWSGEDAGRRAYADEVAALYS